MHACDIRRAPSAIPSVTTAAACAGVDGGVQGFMTADISDLFGTAAKATSAVQCACATVSSPHLAHSFTSSTVWDLLRAAYMISIYQL
jgi:hypothetical protein